MNAIARHDMTISVGFLMAYDYDLLRTSLPLVYDHADAIVLSCDQDCRTWRGHPFTIDPGFFDWLTAFDTSRKVQVHYGPYADPGRPPMECDTAQRQALADHCRDFTWHVQLDSDEYLLDAGAFFVGLRNRPLPSTTPIALTAEVYSVFKRLEGSYLVVENAEVFPIAFRRPVFSRARWGEGAVESSGGVVLHQSWARGKSELQEKVRSWSHAEDFDTTAFVRFWEQIDHYNYRFLRNFHPLAPATWGSLARIEASTVQELVERFPHYLAAHRAADPPVASRWRAVVRGLLPPYLYRALQAVSRRIA